MTRQKKYWIAIVLITLVACDTLWITYVPEHWLAPMGVVPATKDERAVFARFYIGNPTYYEGEGIGLIEVPGVGNYFVTFDDEKYREASRREFVHLFSGVWTFKSMRAGHFIDPLPSHTDNELRIVTRGGNRVVVEF